eukprot:TRINITY_DN1241_c0_g1_i3.p1 TRINITY_DN1241_c0_g1~~TRINITY_DN1241_c0_g1_i3.p1  ORF type:complete len:288 (-),score=47.02 TRINITY_DN1241_c0_g1_i3:21-884(-)
MNRNISSLLITPFLRTNILLPSFSRRFHSLPSVNEQRAVYYTKTFDLLVEYKDKHEEELYKLKFEEMKKFTMSWLRPVAGSVLKEEFEPIYHEITLLDQDKGGEIVGNLKGLVNRFIDELDNLKNEVDQIKKDRDQKEVHFNNEINQIKKDRDQKEDALNRVVQSIYTYDVLGVLHNNFTLPHIQQIYQKHKVKIQDMGDFWQLYARHKNPNKLEEWVKPLNTVLVKAKLPSINKIKDLTDSRHAFVHQHKIRTVEEQRAFLVKIQSYPFDDPCIVEIIDKLLKTDL